MRIHGARKCKGRTNFLSNVERREKMDTPKVNGKYVISPTRERGRRIKSGHDEFKSARGTHTLESPNASGDT